MRLMSRMIPRVSMSSPPTISKYGLLICELASSHLPAKKPTIKQWNYVNAINKANRDNMNI
jgi:hypothetical protein